MNYYRTDNDGSLEFKLGPVYFASFSQVEYDEQADHGDIGLSQGFCDIYLDLGSHGQLHLGLGTGQGDQNILEIIPADAFLY